MPHRPPAACRRAGCPGKVDNHVCSVCGPTRKQWQRGPDERESAHRRGYGRRWRRLRRMYLRGHPLCVSCQAAGLTVAATDVHHITARRDGGTDAWDNLEALCHSCHSRVTAAGG